jgi:esterase/lipase
MVDQKVETIELSAPSNREFFLIHGYTGSPTDFNPLPGELNAQFQANVRILRLAGHGTRVSDLDHVSYEDLLNQVETALQADLEKGRAIILGGVSFGAQLALILASRYPVKGVFNICLPYKLKFPFNLPGMKILARFKKYWKKPPRPEEEPFRTHSFSYDQMHGNGLVIAQAANRELRKCASQITCPILTIHAAKDPIGDHRGGFELLKSVRSEIRRARIYYLKAHNVLYSSNSDDAHQEVIRFIGQNRLFEDAHPPGSVAAVVPAYDEAERIADVLAVLDRTPILNEVIVVDDGSRDNTEQIVKRFNKPRCLKNPKNMGKAYSMDLGVKSTNAEIIFFCDADLNGLTPDIVETIVEPVRKNQCDMFIGLRGNLMQKAVPLFAVNSGERAVRREVWENLPACFKRGYRVEAGLNYFTKRYGRGFRVQRFPYSQSIKEAKYGVWRGTGLRWRMNYEVSIAYLRAILDRL